MKNFKTKNFIYSIVVIAIFAVSILGCRPVHTGGTAPTGFIQTNDVGWSTIQLREGLTYDQAFNDVLDVVAKRFEMDVISKDGAYGRSQWSYRWGVNGGSSYRTRVMFKFTPDKTKLDIKTEAEWNSFGSTWKVGYDTRLLETIKQDIMGVVSRTTM